MKIFIFILLFSSSLSWGLTFKNGEQTGKNDISKNIDSSNILFKINAGLADNDTTINIPGKAEFPKHIHSIYQELIKDINYSLLEVVTNDTRFGNTSLKFKLGKKCIGDRDDCERTEMSYSRVEFKQVDEDYSKNPDNVWTSFSFKIDFICLIQIFKGSGPGAFPPEVTSFAPFGRISEKSKSILEVPSK